MSTIIAFKRAFPDDILRLIIECLRPMPTPHKLGYLPVLLEAEREKQIALYSLALTNRASNTLAVPILYSIIIPTAEDQLRLPDLAEVVGLPKSFRESSRTSSYSCTRSLHLSLARDSNEEDLHAILDILEACSSTIVELVVQGNVGWLLPLTPLARLGSLLANCQSLQRLAVSFPSLDPQAMHSILRPLSQKPLLLSSMQVFPSPFSSTAPEAGPYEVMLKVASLHLQIHLEHVPSYPLQSVDFICISSFVELFSLRGYSALDLWESPRQHEGKWPNLQEIHLWNDVSWKPLYSDPTLAANAARILPAFQTLRASLPFGQEDAELYNQLRRYPSNLVNLHLSVFWWRVPTVLADLLAEEPRVLPALQFLELGMRSLNIQRKQVALRKAGATPDGMEALQEICRIRGIETQPENLVQEPVWDEDD